MSTGTKPRSYNLPLVDKPIDRDYRIRGPNSEIVVNINACPNRAVQYRFNWTKRPPDGKKAACEGQVTLKRIASGKSADRLAIVRAISDGNVYAGPTVGDYSHHSLRAFQLHDVDDIDFSGKILESE